MTTPELLEISPNYELAELTMRDGITIELLSQQAEAGGIRLRLTRTEFRLLAVLHSEPGRTFHRSELMKLALGEDALVLARTIDVHIRALRRKLGPYAAAIETVRGIGYRFQAEPAGLDDGEEAC